MDESYYLAKIRKLEAEIDEMTEALARAWDQLVPFLQDTPQQASSAQDITPILEAIMAAVDTPVGAIYLAKHDQWLTYPEDLVMQDALQNQFLRFQDKTTEIYLTDIPAWHISDLTDWMFMPMSIDDDIIGAIGVGHIDKKKTFSAYDRQLLRRMTERATSQILATNLAESRAREARLAHELQIANLIQQSIQPSKPPPLKYLDIASYWLPARSVGGDAWGWEIQEDRLSVFILDVSGKGLPAALAAVALHTAAKMALRLNLSPQEVLATLNDQFYDAYTNAGIFATMTVLSIDFKTGMLEQANAGHTPTIICHQGKWQFLEATAPPIGVLPFIEFERQALQLYLDDMVICYSDGFTELETPDGMWGHDGFMSALSTRHPNLSSRLNFVLQEVEEIQVDESMNDDQTIVMLQWKKVDEL